MDSLSTHVRNDHRTNPSNRAGWSGAPGTVQHGWKDNRKGAEYTHVAYKLGKWRRVNRYPLRKNYLATSGGQCLCLLDSLCSLEYSDILILLQGCDICLEDVSKMTSLCKAHGDIHEACPT
jgi:hypothetical protein